MIGWRRYRRRRVIVNLKAGGALEGILYAAPRGLLELRDATAHVEGRNGGVPIDGAPVVELANVEWVQVLPAPTPAIRAE